jgi:DNA-binding transcriptional ArsR family regulator
MGQDEVSSTFAALADPVRRAILTRLAAGGATVTELAEPFSITPQAVSKHLKVLERAGLLTRDRAGQRRPARLRDEPLETSQQWIAGYRRLISGRLDRLDDTLQDLKREKETGR